MDRGCFCCRLETCVKIQGFVVSVGCALASSVITVALCIVKMREPHVNDVATKRILLDLTTVLIVMFVVMTAWALIGVLLLFGVYKRRRVLLLPFIIAASLSLLACLGLTLYVAGSRSTPIASAVVMASFLALQLYSLLHVSSLYTRMGAAEQSVHFLVVENACTDSLPARYRARPDDGLLDAMLQVDDEGPSPSRLKETIPFIDDEGVHDGS